MFDPTDPDYPPILTADDVLPPPVRNSRTAAQVAQSLSHDLTAPKLPGVFTGIGPLDASLGAGMQPSEMMIIAADTGVGKSILGFQIATHNAGLGLGRVLYISAEMTAESLAMRYITARCEVPVSRQRGGMDKLTDADWMGAPRTGRDDERWPINTALAAFAELDLEILDSGDFTIEELEREITTCENVRLVVIDYAQLIDAEGKSATNAEVMKLICKRLRAIRLRRCVIVALAQINRAVEGRSDKELRLSDIAETGSLAKDAEVVLMLERDTAGDTKHKAIVRFRKNRHGEPGPVPLYFNASRLTFERMR